MKPWRQDHLVRRSFVTVFALAIIVVAGCSDGGAQQQPAATAQATADTDEELSDSTDPTLASDTLDEPIGDCASMPMALAECRSFVCEASHPYYDRNNFRLRREVVGQADDILCDYRESVPPDQTMLCRFPEDAAQFYASVLKQTFEGYARGDLTLSTDEDQPKPYAGHCNIVRPDGSTVVTF
ncbi:MAG: hypothetical protein AAF290_17185 [Pseudomonadota bacterium]